MGCQITLQGITRDSSGLASTTVFRHYPGLAKTSCFRKYYKLALDLLTSVHSEHGDTAQQVLGKGEKSSMMHYPTEEM